MKLSKLIKDLQKLQTQLKTDPDVIVDQDENGYFNVEDVNVTSDAGEVLVNIKSSNEM